MAQYGVTVFRDDSEPSVLGSARSEASVYLGSSGDLRAETHTLDSFGISDNKVMSSIFQLFPATSLNRQSSFIKPLLAEQQRHVSCVGAGRN
jgi:hypothetical protein